MILCLCLFLFIMVPSPCQFPGVAGKMCNRFLPSKENDPHRLCTVCRGKTCDIEDHCEDCQFVMTDLTRNVAV